MIFITVGGQLPFDRLVHAVDRWAAQQERTDVFAQIGKSSSPPKYIEWQRFLSPTEFQAKAREAEVIVAHAGIGSILTALELGKPIVLVPRRAQLGEHRNDHQWATVKYLRSSAGVVVAADEDELREQLERLEELPNAIGERRPEYECLLDFLRNWIDEPA